MTIDIHDIEAIIQQQDTWRQTLAINLIASENTPSEAVRRVQTSDFMGRYAEVILMRVIRSIAIIRARAISIKLSAWPSRNC
ncbi:hypothetical protein [Dictyobacter kobayashii]|uniref:Serine hydroxymethyltransferase-like domain-containing protein n=1 Tax=Dictyobacter kobayashii TaxID=2014872 RepID=A0A402AE53_9CHLR|nr:hypothetical protein [Dictyobacter kobayashii]GCE17375.1 hypothetical protein KDK_11750 [Dictyobacter kobayashii]